MPAAPIPLHSNLFSAVAEILAAPDHAAKSALGERVAKRFVDGALSMQDAAPVMPIAEPGRPPRPFLVAPRDLPHRGLGTIAGRAALVHAVAHIEFNAINLAWDAVYRFRNMPRAYYLDWISVAQDEARHFGLLQTRLAELGHAYGDFDAHNGLWEMAEKTAGSCLERMALVPRVLEARGLDVTPGMIARLRAVGDTQTSAILELILNEEIVHVAAGSRWFAWCCAAAGREPQATFAQLVAQHVRGAVRGPFNETARLAAGFSAAELADMSAAVS